MGEAEKKQDLNDEKIHGRTSKKNQGLSALEPPPPGQWQLLYWPAFNSEGKLCAGAGRGEYLRVLFEEAGVPYEEVNAHLSDYFWTKLELQPEHFPVLAPPAIRKDNFALSQTPVCAKYLATQFGLYPEDPLDAAKAEQTVYTVHEYIAEGVAAYHPVKASMSYVDQKEEAKPYIEAFKRERLPRYFGNLERILKSNNGGSGFFIGDTASYVDFQVMVALQCTANQWPDIWAAKSDIPLLKAFLERMEARPKMKAYLASSRRKPFAGDSLM